MTTNGRWMVLALALAAGPAAAQNADLHLRGVVFDYSNNPGQIRFHENWGEGGHYFYVQGQAELDATFGWTWPAANPPATRCLQVTSAGQLEYASDACAAGGGSGLPVSDSTSIVEGSLDLTKQMRFEVDDFLTTGTTRVLSVQDANYVIAGTNIGNLWSDDQYYSNNKWLLWADSVGTYIPIIRLDANDHLTVQTRDAGGNVRRALWTDDDDKLHIGLEDGVGDGVIVLHTLGDAIELPDSLVPPDAADNNFLRFNTAGKAVWDAVAAVNVANNTTLLTPRGTLNFGLSLLATDAVGYSNVDINPEGITLYTRAQYMGGGLKGKIGGGGADSDDVGGGLDSLPSYGRTPFRRGFFREYTQAPSVVLAHPADDISVTSNYWAGTYSGGQLAWYAGSSVKALWSTGPDNFRFEGSVTPMTGGSGSLGTAGAPWDAGVVEKLTVGSFLESGVLDIENTVGQGVRITASTQSMTIARQDSASASAIYVTDPDSGGINLFILESANVSGTNQRGVLWVGDEATLTTAKLSPFWLEIQGNQVVGSRGAAVADASGGSTVDSQARTAINTLLSRLRTHGLIAP